MKAVAFVDYENIWTGVLDRGYELSPEQLIQFLHDYASRTGIQLLAVYLYANFDREEFWRTQTTFEKTNVFTRHVYGKNNFANTGLRRNAADLELMLEAQEILLTRLATFDMFVFLTGDGDFFPLVRKIRAWGKEVKVIGVDGSVHHSLQPYSENIDILKELFLQDIEGVYHPEEDLDKAIQVLAQLQIHLSYVASTKARAQLVEQLGRSLSQVKELIRHALREKIITEKEHPDPSLKIGRTKIYLLNPEHPLVSRVLGPTLEEVKQRQMRLLASEG